MSWTKHRGSMKVGFVTSTRKSLPFYLYTNNVPSIDSLYTNNVPIIDYHVLH